MKYSSVIFDWDGTLGETLQLWLEGYRNELKKLGFIFSDKIIVGEFFYEHEKAAIKYPDINFPSFMKEVHQYVNSHVFSLKIYPGAREALQKLQKNDIKLALASSSPKKLIIDALQETGLLGFFSTIVPCNDIKKHKPDPEQFKKAIETGKLDPRSTIILGDSRTDILAAKNAGLDSCLFLPPENRLFYDFEELKKTDPTYCVESLKEFADLLVKT